MPTMSDSTTMITMTTTSTVQENQAKKARRRDLDQRRDLRRQREAAMQIGLNGVNDGADDAVVVQMIIEEQIAAENNQR